LAANKGDYRYRGDKATGDRLHVRGGWRRHAIVVEEFMQGKGSFFAQRWHQRVPLAGAQDLKRVGDGDTGPSTGGWAPIRLRRCCHPALERVAMEKFISPRSRPLRRAAPLWALPVWADDLERPQAGGK
jgi:phosphoribosylamine--glycine ligase